MEKVRRTKNLFWKDNNTFSTFKERKKQKGNKLRIMRLPRQSSRSLEKIIFFWKRQHNTPADILFSSPEENEKPSEIITKKCPLFRARRKNSWSCTVSSNNYTYYSKEVLYPGQCLAFLAWKDIDKWCLKAKG